MDVLNKIKEELEKKYPMLELKNEDGALKAYKIGGMKVNNNTVLSYWADDYGSGYNTDLNFSKENGLFEEHGTCLPAEKVQLKKTYEIFTANNGLAIVFEVAAIKENYCKIPTI